MTSRVMTKVIKIMYTSHLTEIVIFEEMPSKRCPMRAVGCPAEGLESSRSAGQAGYPHLRREPHAMLSGSLRIP